MDRATILPLLTITIVYLVLAVSYARTTMPWCDEAWFSSPALSLVTQGHMGTPVLDETAAWEQRDLTSVSRYTYWTTPLYALSLSFWLRIFPFSLLAVRLYSVLWGCAALIGWWLVMRKLSGTTTVASLTVALLAVDFTFLWSAGVGRMDMMCEALSIGGIAAYLWCRERSFLYAVLLSHTCIAAAGLVHPMALGAGAALVALTLFFDWRRIRPATLGAAAMPYVLGAAAWGIYIAKNPEVFWSQFRGNVSAGRFVSGSVIDWVHGQVVERYAYMYGLAPDTQGLSHIKVAILAAYALGLAGMLSSGRLRAHRGYRALLLLWLVSSIAMSLTDSGIRPFYLIYFLTPLIAVLAVWLHESWMMREMPQWVPAIVLGTVVCTQLLVTGSRIRRDAYLNDYRPSTTFLRQHARPADVTFGSAELGFDLGFFDGGLVDDFRLGFRSGRQATFIVLDHNRYQEWIPNLKETEPAAYHYIVDMLAHDFELVHQNRAYQIYARKASR